MLFMRRKDREIVDETKMLEIMDACDTCRLGLWDGKQVYIVPLNFGYQKTAETFRLYFHCALDGRKIDCIKAFPNIGFEMDTQHHLKRGNEACEYTFLYQSIIGNAKSTLLFDKEQKVKALQVIMNHYENSELWSFQEAMIDRIMIIQLDITNWTCKELR